MNDKSLLVIVVTYNGMKWLDKCLSSVLNSSVDADLFIVDNGSTDGSIGFVKKNYPQAILIESCYNLGFGRANNLGLKYAIDLNYEYVYLLNQDAWVDPDVFEKLISLTKTNPEYGIISPLQCNSDKTNLDYNFGNQISYKVVSDYLCKNYVNEIYPVKFVMAAHWMMPINTIKTVGAFSPTFPHYGEDTNYVNRLHHFNLKIGISTKSFAVHDREFREETIEKKIYMNYIQSLIELSSLDNTYVRNILRALNSIIGSLLIYKSINSIKYIFKLIYNLNKIHKNRQISKNKSAFL